jgi:hypothetical protein
MGPSAERPVMMWAFFERPDQSGAAFFDDGAEINYAI